MGREIKRVPADFDWPLNAVWPGYLCTPCTEEMKYALHDKPGADPCVYCRMAATFIGLKIKSYGCPEWRRDPPVGTAYQVWETVSEGSPISPAFEDPNELAAWMVANDTSITKGRTQEQWLKFILGPGWAPSLAVKDGAVVSGVQAMTQEERADAAGEETR